LLTGQKRSFLSSIHHRSDTLEELLAPKEPSPPETTSRLDLKSNKLHNDRSRVRDIPLIRVRASHRDYESMRLDFHPYKSSTVSPPSQSDNHKRTRTGQNASGTSVRSTAFAYPTIPNFSSIEIPSSCAQYLESKLRFSPLTKDTRKVHSSSPPVALDSKYVIPSPFDPPLCRVQS
jgi:hypothetical protein